MKRFFFTLIVITIFSCKKEGKSSIIQGDICIKLIDVHNIIYGMPEDKIKEFKKRINNPNQSDYSESEKKLNDYHKILIKHDLYNKPHFKLKTVSGQIINVYTNELEYSKLKKELTDFDRDSQKITIKFKGTKISDGIIDSDGIFNQAIFEANEIIFIEKSKGKTYWEK